MARRGRSERMVVEIPQSGGVLYETILAKLKPDREITAGEFLKRAFTFPQIERIKVQKFAGGTWNFAEDIDNIGPGFNPDNIEALMREKYGPWRFRLLVVMNGETVTQHLINLDGWQENEARSQASLPRTPILSSGSKPVGAGATSELLAAARERVEIENTTRLLAGLDRDRHESSASAEMAPAKMMAEMMTSMMAMMREAMAMSRGHPSPSEEDRFTAYLRDEVRFMREQMAKPIPARDTDALTKTIEGIDTLLTRVLNTSLAEMVSGTSKIEATGWAATIQGVIEGLKPYLPEILLAFKAATPSAPAVVQTVPLSTVPPWNTRSQSLPASPPIATPSPTPPATPEEAPDMPPKINSEMLDVINLLVDALRSKNFKTIDAILGNPPLGGRMVIEPDVPAMTYAIMFANVDPRFREMHAEIAAYQLYQETPPNETE